MQKPVLLIPAFKPEKTLDWVLDSKVTERFQKILVVNDGSPPECEDIFELIKSDPKIQVLNHAVNLGKGAALRTGLNSILLEKNNCLDFPGVVTADADGQHSIPDIIAVADSLVADSSRLILGARSFDGSVPLRSKIGNLTTRVVFRFLTGLSITDTQTGLRGIPRARVAKLMKCNSNGYEFEMEMLVISKDLTVPIHEIPISTIYINNNASSHFNPLFDSFKIYFVLLRYLTSSISAAIVDYFVFVFFWSLGTPLWMCVILGRLVSVILNFSLNYKFVFKQDGVLTKSFFKYITLVVVSGTATYIFTYYFLSKLNIPPPIGKLLAEISIFFANFLIQREWVFKRRTNSTSSW
jgi:putative flippase GtrA